eukprot:403343454
MQKKAAIPTQNLQQITSLLHNGIVTIYDVMRELCIDSIQAKRVMMDFAFQKSTKQKVIKLFIIERQQSAQNSPAKQFQLVYEHELASIIESGEKIENAYIYAVFEDSFDIDSELFNTARFAQSFDTFNQVITFEPSQKVKHQNALNRQYPNGSTAQITSQIKPPSITANIGGTQQKQQTTTVKSTTQAATGGQQKVQQQLFGGNQQQSKLGTSTQQKPVAQPAVVKQQKPKEVVMIEDDEEEVYTSTNSIKPAKADKPIGDKVMGDQPVTTTTTETQKQTGDKSQDSLVKKLQSNKLHDSDEEETKANNKKSTQNSSGKKRLNKTKDTEMQDETTVKNTKPPTTMSDDEDAIQRTNRNKKQQQKRATLMLDDSDEDDNKNNEMEVQSSSIKENNTNIGNLMKVKMGAVVVDPKANVKSTKELLADTVPKGKRKVLKTRIFTDEKGYEVIEDYDSYEEYDLPPPKTTSIVNTKKPAVTKNVINLATNNTKAQTQQNAATKQAVPDSKAKSQHSLASFFSRKQ